MAVCTGNISTGTAYKLALSLLCGGIAILLIRSAYAALPVEPQPVPSAVGVSIGHQRGDEWAAQSLELLQPPLWMNWIYDHNDDLTYIPMAYYLRHLNRYVEAGQAARHKTWLLGNEPELVDGRATPEEAALFVEQWKNEVGSPFACCGTIISYGNGLQWLTDYLAVGGSVPDYWHIHIYAVPTPTEWQQALDNFISWMETNNAVRPIIVSETAQTEHGSAVALLEYISAKVEDGTIHAALWYSDMGYWQAWPQSDLRTEAGELTELGKVYTTLGNIIEPTDEDVIAQPSMPRTLYVPHVEN